MLYINYPIPMSKWDAGAGNYEDGDGDCVSGPDLASLKASATGDWAFVDENRKKWGFVASQPGSKLVGAGWAAAACCSS